MTQMYEAALQKVTGAAAGHIVTMVTTSTSRPDIRELGIFMSSAPATGPTIGIGRPAAVGSGASGGVLGQADDAGDPAAVVTIVPTWTTGPTAPTVFMRRITLPATIGAGVIWTWEPNMLNVPVSSNFMIYQISALAVTYDIYWKWEE